MGSYYRGILNNITANGDKKMYNTNPIIAVAEDDLDDQLLIVEALKEANLVVRLVFLNNGIELLEYLYRLGRYQKPSDSPVPGLVLLDLNMPRLDGREALRKMRADTNLIYIPVVALTTSNNPEEIELVYELGANGYVCKPNSFGGLVNALKVIYSYWFETVTIPSN